ncbi:carboxymuconolactone decarboxylase family protein [Argonema antarcticum]|uniref:carboxymuconolactone decarboxylase family protein n=1 Tax=Argonema antarcticum TaxID=2942763 RepID=UPI0020125E29|nr:carboxymuconolactone decarboxylase family protein [Argonema antarcticum]MCL1470595.1 carboxymuconolactone decarboxylase family protein [Argonema antarcticum A004/B2]
MAYYYKNAVLEDKDLQNALKSLNPKFGDFVTRVAGEVWGLPLIDQKTKAIITIAVDVANQDQKGPGNPFGAHIDMALKQGATREEVEAVLLFLCVYTGFNKVASCFGALNEFFDNVNLQQYPPPRTATMVKTANPILDNLALQKDLKSVNPQLGDFSIRVVGEAWSLPLIDIKTKALIALAVDIANQDHVGPNNPFSLHLDIAFQNGVTREEIEELLLFLCVYTGFNKVAAAFGSLNEYLAQRRI